MVDFLIQILNWILSAVFFIGMIGVVIYLFSLALSPFFGKKTKEGSSPMPWWVWWSSYSNHND